MSALLNVKDHSYNLNRLRNAKKSLVMVAEAMVGQLLLLRGRSSVTGSVLSGYAGCIAAH